MRNQKMSDIMSKSIRPLTAALACLGLGLSIQATTAQAELGYLTDTAGDVVTTSAGDECWKISDGLAPPVEACGDEVVVVVEEVDPCSLDSDGDGVNDCIDECVATISGGKVDAVGCLIIEDMVLNATADEFAFDSAELKPEMKALLDDVAAKIEASPGDETIQVIGYTDSTGPEEYNLGLSERRAQSAADYLIEQGVAADRVSTMGMGESDPVADNSTREGRAMNRRVEIKTQ
jgi:OOP family OmpA-OmpF porin